MKHDPNWGTYLALLSTEGRLTVYQTESPEALGEYASIDEFSVCKKPSRGEEVSFRVRFDPGEEPCYSALRAGVGSDSLGLVVAAMGTVKLYRSRDVVTASFGSSQTQKEFYLAVEITGHRGLVRDVAWAPGNIRGYDIIATAGQDGYARVYRIDTPYSDSDGKSWSVSSLIKSDTQPASKDHPTTQYSKNNSTGGEQPSTSSTPQQAPSSTLSASLAKSGTTGDRQWAGQPGQVKHTAREISRLDNDRKPVWRVGFDDDGQILGTTGDDGKLMCYRQLPDGSWAQSSELAIVKASMVAP
jgi:nucleoporin SEH1